MSRRVLALALALTAPAAACTEDLTAPCPADSTAPGPGPYCPAGEIVLRDTILTGAVVRDTAFRGYVRAHESGALLVASLPWVQSRAIFRTGFISPTYRVGTDTTQRPIAGVDSLRLRLILFRRDTAAHDLTLHLYRVPLTIDTNTAFADVPFTDSVRSVNVDTLLAQPGFRDSVTGDSVAVDSASGRLVLLLKLDSTQAPYVPADSGKLAFGIRVTADTLATVALGAARGLGAPHITWFLHVDTAGVAVPITQPAVTVFNSFVFDPPPAPIDSTLAVGGVPSARSYVRIDLPRKIRDSTQILRGTLVLVPAVPARGAPVDSFLVYALPLLADIGAKSPPVSLALRDSAMVRIDAADTIRIELTRTLRVWASDTLLPTALLLQQIPEAERLGEVRFYPSSAAAVRPALHLTFVERFDFGKP